MRMIPVTIPYLSASGPPGIASTQPPMTACHLHTTSSGRALSRYLHGQYIPCSQRGLESWGLHCMGPKGGGSHHCCSVFVSYMTPTTLSTPGIERYVRSLFFPQNVCYAKAMHIFQFKGVPFVVRRLDTDIHVLPMKYLDELRLMPRNDLNGKMVHYNVSFLLFP